MLTEKQRRFAEFYAADPNATEAAKAAGYSERTAYSLGARLLKNVEIANLIRQLQDEAARGRVASMVQAKAFWSRVMLDPAERTADRLRASELLARAAGAFLHVRDDDGAFFAGSSGETGDVVIYLPKTDAETDLLWNEEDEKC